MILTHIQSTSWVLNVQGCPQIWVKSKKNQLYRINFKIQNQAYTVITTITARLMAVGVRTAGGKLANVLSDGGLRKYNHEEYKKGGGKLHIIDEWMLFNARVKYVLTLVPRVGKNVLMGYQH